MKTMYKICIKTLAALAFIVAACIIGITFWHMCMPNSLRWLSSEDLLYLKLLTFMVLIPALFFVWLVENFDTWI